MTVSSVPLTDLVRWVVESLDSPLKRGLDTVFLRGTMEERYPLSSIP